MSNAPIDVRFVFPESNAVSLGGVRPIAWMGILTFATGGGFALRYAADDGALYAITRRGRRLRMPWAHVQRIEIGTGGSAVFYGDDAQFVLPPPSLWSGPAQGRAGPDARRAGAPSGCHPRVERYR